MDAVAPARHRIVTWHDPADLHRRAQGLTGLDVLHRFASGQVTVTDSPGTSISSNYNVDFDAMDTNDDGAITRAEASGNADLMREFHVVDANANGRLTREEMKGWLD